METRRGTTRQKERERLRKAKQKDVLREKEKETKATGKRSAREKEKETQKKWSAEEGR